MARYLLMAGILISTGNTALFAQDISPIEADRPDQTETPSTVPKDHFQMETGFSFEQTDEDTKSFSHPSALFKYGVNDHFELRLITDFTTITSGGKNMSGLNPVTVGFKINISQEKGILPTTSFLGHLTVPTLASKHFKSTWYAPAFRFSMQHTLSPRLSLGYNLGAEWDGESPEPIFIYTLTTSYSISEKIGAYAEIYGFAPQKRQADHLFDCGINYLLKPNILFDVSGGVGLTNDAPDYFIGLGFSFRLKD